MTVRISVPKLDKQINNKFKKNKQVNMKTRNFVIEKQDGSVSKVEDNVGDFIRLDTKTQSQKKNF